MIVVERLAGDDPLVFAVRVREAAGETRHETTIRAPEATRLAHGGTPEALIEAAFRFLLDREPKEAILARFDLGAIPRYFPEFEGELPRYLKPTIKPS